MVTYDGDRSMVHFITYHLVLNSETMKFGLLKHKDITSSFDSFRSSHPSAQNQVYSPSQPYTGMKWMKRLS